MTRRISGSPNWWGWGWGPGHQETAEFTILESYFTAMYGVKKRVEFIDRLSNHPGCWELTFTDGTSQLVVA